MSDKILNELQASDANGNAVINANKPTAVNGTGTVTLVSGQGVWLGLTIWASDSDGTFYFKDGDGDAITGLPNSTNKGVLSALGAFAVPRYEIISGGLQIVTESAETLVATSWSFVVSP
jgi:hypothetical protein